MLGDGGTLRCGGGGGIAGDRDADAGGGEDGEDDLEGLDAGLAGANFEDNGLGGSRLT